MPVQDRTNNCRIIDRPFSAGVTPMDFTLYWFMLPVAALVATCAMLSGIGGAALFTPIFILVFPLLGPQYPLESGIAAIGTALLTQIFGFSSGFISYYRRRLIDFGLAAKFLRISAPVAIVGALAAGALHDAFIVGGYALLAGILAYILFFHSRGADFGASTSPAVGDNAGMRRRTDRAGKTYFYRDVVFGPAAVLITSIGAFLTGLLSVGIGEVIVPQLTRRGVPMAVAAATSVAVVIVTVACASFTLVGQMVAKGGLSAVPWSLVCYTIPGVIIGGQIGPHLHGRISQRQLDRANGVLFLLIAIAMAIVSAKKFSA